MQGKRIENRKQKTEDRSQRTEDGGQRIEDGRRRLELRLLRHFVPPKKINGFRIVRFEIATVAFGSFAMTLLVHFLLHTF